MQNQRAQHSPDPYGLLASPGPKWNREAIFKGKRAARPADSRYDWILRQPHKYTHTCTNAAQLSFSALCNSNSTTLRLISSSSTAEFIKSQRIVRSDKIISKDSSFSHLSSFCGPREWTMFQPREQLFLEIIGLETQPPPHALCDNFHPVLGKQRYPMRMAQNISANNLQAFFFLTQIWKAK